MAEIFSGNLEILGNLINDEARETTHIKMKPSIVLKARLKAKEEGKTLGRWLEDAIEEKIEREQRVKAVK